LARIERLEAELQELRAAVGAPIERPRSTGDRPRNSIVEPHWHADPPADVEAHSAPEPLSDVEPHAGATSRRRAVGMLAAGAIGALAAAVESQPAAAADNDAVFLGEVNTFTTNISTVIARGSPSNNYVSSALNLEAPAGFGVALRGGWGNAWMWGMGRAPTSDDALDFGIIWVHAGNWWVSVAEGQWRQIAGPSFTPGSGGSFTPLKVPKRVYDTRKSEKAPGFKAEFAPNETREIDLTAGGSGVPKSAKAVQISYVVIHPPNPGYAVAWPSGPKPDTSQVNYPGGRSDVRGACVVIGAVNGKIFINSLGGGDIAVDVYGYFT
jgi:hypothetical protein